jgi:hypothetical protein
MADLLAMTGLIGMTVAAEHQVEVADERGRDLSATDARKGGTWAACSRFSLVRSRESPM